MTETRTIQPERICVPRSAGNTTTGHFGLPNDVMFEAVLSSGKFELGPHTIDTGLNYSGPARVGIRPDAIQWGNDIPAEVSWTENLGPQFLVGVRIGQVPLSVLTRERPVSNSVVISFAPGDVHVFDKDSGSNISRRCHRRTVDSQSP